MLDFLFSFFKKEASLTNISAITGYLDRIVSLLESEFAKDPNAKDAAIDAVIQIIQNYKSNPPASNSTPTS